MIVFYIIMAVIIAVSVFSYVTARIMFDTCAKREETEISRRVLYKHINKLGKDVAKIYEDGENYINSLPCEEMSILSEDGLRLYANYYSHEKADTLAVLVHGYHSCGALDFAPSFSYFYDELGCDVLLVSQRTHGKSEGMYITYGEKEKDDIVRWCNEFPTKKIILYGISMGAATVLLAAQSGMNLKAVIADSGYSGLMDEFSYVLNKVKHIPSLLVEPFLWRICKKKAQYDPLLVDVSAEMYKIKTRVLFIHGISDWLVPLSHGERNYSAFNGKKEFLKIENAGHATGFAFAPELCKSYIKSICEVQ